MAKSSAYNGNGLSVRKRANVLALLKSGAGIRETARKSGACQAVVIALRNANCEQLQASKELLALECEQGAIAALDRMRAEVANPKAKLSAPQLVPVFGVMVDKMLALRGDALPLPPQLHAHVHVHEFAQRNLKPVSRAEIIDALPARNDAPAL